MDAFFPWDVPSISNYVGICRNYDVTFRYRSSVHRPGLRSDQEYIVDLIPCYQLWVWSSVRYDERLERYHLSSKHAGPLGCGIVCCIYRLE